MTPRKDNRLTDPSEMGIQELMDLLEAHGYSTSSLSNDEILDLAYEIHDGNGYGDEEVTDENKSVDWGDHPDDMTYTSDKPPEGVCANRYCPDGRVRHEELVRGYCSPCASIRRPVVSKKEWRAGREEWADQDHEPTPFYNDLWRVYR
jgi:hypothetical protein